MLHIVWKKKLNTFFSPLSSFSVWVIFVVNFLHLNYKRDAIKHLDLVYFSNWLCSQRKKMKLDKFQIVFLALVAISAGIFLRAILLANYEYFQCDSKNVKISFFSRQFCQHHNLLRGEFSSMSLAKDDNKNLCFSLMLRQFAGNSTESHDSQTSNGPTQILGRNFFEFSFIVDWNVKMNNFAYNFHIEIVNVIREVIRAPLVLTALAFYPIACQLNEGGCRIGTNESPQFNVTTLDGNLS